MSALASPQNAVRRTREAVLQMTTIGMVGTEPGTS